MSTLSEDADAVRTVLQTEPTPGPWRAIKRGAGPDEAPHLTYYFIEAGDRLGEQPGTGFHLSGFLATVDAQLIAAAPRLLTALREIAKGEGAFSRDPIEHAKNTIEAMKALARTAIAATELRP